MQKGQRILCDGDVQVRKYTPVLRCSICTGEQTTGFRDKKTGAFREIMLIRDEKDLQEFKDTYGVKELKKEY